LGKSRIWFLFKQKSAHRLINLLYDLADSGVISAFGAVEILGMKDASIEARTGLALDGAGGGAWSWLSK
jgi:hypothetical protein